MKKFKELVKKAYKDLYENVCEQVVENEGSCMSFERNIVEGDKYCVIAYFEGGLYDGCKVFDECEDEVSMPNIKKYIDAYFDDFDAVEDTQHEYFDAVAYQMP